jgi:hypothetical protein
VLKQTLKLFETLSNIALKAESALLKADPLASAGTAALLQPRLLAVVQADLADPSGKPQKVISAIAPASCFGPATTPAASMFPGECAGAATAADLSTCSAAVAKCHFCRALNVFDGLEIDCDQFDNGTPDASCD